MNSIPLFSLLDEFGNDSDDSSSSPTPSANGDNRPRDGFDGDDDDDEHGEKFYSVDADQSNIHNYLYRTRYLNSTAEARDEFFDRDDDDDISNLQSVIPDEISIQLGDLRCESFDLEQLRRTLFTTNLVQRTTHAHSKTTEEIMNTMYNLLNDEPPPPPHRQQQNQMEAGSFVTQVQDEPGEVVLPDLLVVQPSDANVFAEGSNQLSSADASRTSHNQTTATGSSSLSTSHGDHHKLPNASTSLLESRNGAEYLSTQQHPPSFISNNRSGSTALTATSRTRSPHGPHSQSSSSPNGNLSSTTMHKPTTATSSNNSNFNNNNNNNNNNNLSIGAYTVKNEISFEQTVCQQLAERTSRRMVLLMNDPMTGCPSGTKPGDGRGSGSGFGGGSGGPPGSEYARRQQRIDVEEQNAVKQSLAVARLGTYSGHVALFLRIANQAGYRGTSRVVDLNLTSATIAKLCAAGLQLATHPNVIYRGRNPGVVTLCFFQAHKQEATARRERTKEKKRRKQKKSQLRDEERLRRMMRVVDAKNEVGDDVNASCSSSSSSSPSLSSSCSSDDFSNDDDVVMDERGSDVKKRTRDRRGEDDDEHFSSRNDDHHQHQAQEQRKRTGGVSLVAAQLEAAFMARESRFHSQRHSDRMDESNVTSTALPPSSTAKMKQTASQGSEGKNLTREPPDGTHHSQHQGITATIAFDGTVKSKALRFDRSVARALTMDRVQSEAKTHQVRFRPDHLNNSCSRNQIENFELEDCDSVSTNTTTTKTTPTKSFQARSGAFSQYGHATAHQQSSQRLQRIGQVQTGLDDEKSGEHLHHQDQDDLEPLEGDGVAGNYLAARRKVHCEEDDDGGGRDDQIDDGEAENEQEKPQQQHQQKQQISRKGSLRFTSGMDPFGDSSSREKSPFHRLGSRSNRVKHDRNDDWLANPSSVPPEQADQFSVLKFGRDKVTGEVVMPTERKAYNSITIIAKTPDAKSSTTTKLAPLATGGVRSTPSRRASTSSPNLKNSKRNSVSPFTDAGTATTQQQQQQQQHQLQNRTTTTTTTTTRRRRSSVYASDAPFLNMRRTSAPRLHNQKNQEAADDSSAAPVIITRENGKSRIVISTDPRGFGEAKRLDPSDSDSDDELEAVARGDLAFFTIDLKKHVADAVLAEKKAEFMQFALAGPDRTMHLPERYSSTAGSQHTSVSHPSLSVGETALALSLSRVASCGTTNMNSINVNMNMTRTSGAGSGDGTPNMVASATSIQQQFQNLLQQQQQFQYIRDSSSGNTDFASLEYQQQQQQQQHHHHHHHQRADRFSSVLLHNDHSSSSASLTSRQREQFPRIQDNSNNNNNNTCYSSNSNINDIASNVGDNFVVTPLNLADPYYSVINAATRYAKSHLENAMHAASTSSSFAMRSPNQQPQQQEQTQGRASSTITSSHQSKRDEEQKERQNSRSGGGNRRHEQQQRQQGKSIRNSSSLVADLQRHVKSMEMEERAEKERERAARSPLIAKSISALSAIDPHQDPSHRGHDNHARQPSSSSRQLSSLSLAERSCSSSSAVNLSRTLNEMQSRGVKNQNERETSLETNYNDDTVKFHDDNDNNNNNTQNNYNSRGNTDDYVKSSASQSPKPKHVHHSSDGNDDDNERNEATRRSESKSSSLPKKQARFRSDQNTAEDVNCCNIKNAERNDTAQIDNLPSPGVLLLHVRPQVGKVNSSVSAVTTTSGATGKSFGANSQNIGSPPPSSSSLSGIDQQRNYSFVDRSDDSRLLAPHTAQPTKERSCFAVPRFDTGNGCASNIAAEQQQGEQQQRRSLPPSPQIGPTRVTSFLGDTATSNALLHQTLGATTTTTTTTQQQQHQQSRTRSYSMLSTRDWKLRSRVAASNKIEEASKKVAEDLMMPNFSDKARKALKKAAAKRIRRLLARLMKLKVELWCGRSLTDPNAIKLGETHLDLSSLLKQVAQEIFGKAQQQRQRPHEARKHCDAKTTTDNTHYAEEVFHTVSSQCSAVLGSSTGCGEEASIVCTVTLKGSKGGAGGATNGLCLPSSYGDHFNHHQQHQQRRFSTVSQGASAGGGSKIQDLLRLHRRSSSHSLSMALAAEQGSVPGGLLTEQRKRLANTWVPPKNNIYVEDASVVEFERQQAAHQLIGFITSMVSSKLAQFLEPILTKLDQVERRIHRLNVVLNQMQVQQNSNSPSESLMSSSVAASSSQLHQRRSIFARRGSSLKVQRSFSREE